MCEGMFSARTRGPYLENPEGQKLEEVISGVVETVVLAHLDHAVEQPSCHVHAATRHNKVVALHKTCAKTQQRAGAWYICGISSSQSRQAYGYTACSCVRIDGPTDRLTTHRIAMKERDSTNIPTLLILFIITCPDVAPCRHRLETSVRRLTAC